MPELEQVSSDVRGATHSLKMLLALWEMRSEPASLPELQVAGANVTRGSLLHILHLIQTTARCLLDIARQHSLSWESYSSDVESTGRQLHGNIENGAQAAQALMDGLAGHDAGSITEQHTDACELAVTPLFSTTAVQRAGLQKDRKQAPEACGCGWMANACLAALAVAAFIIATKLAYPARPRLHVLACGTATASGSLVVLSLARITRLGKVGQLVSTGAPNWPVLQVHSSLSWRVVQERSSLCTAALEQLQLQAALHDTCSSLVRLASSCRAYYSVPAAARLCGSAQELQDRLELFQELHLWFGALCSAAFALSSHAAAPGCPCTPGPAGAWCLPQNLPVRQCHMVYILQVAC